MHWVLLRLIESGRIVPPGSRWIGRVSGGRYFSVIMSWDLFLPTECDVVLITPRSGDLLLATPTVLLVSAWRPVPIVQCARSAVGRARRLPGQRCAAVAEATRSKLVKQPGISRTDLSGVGVRQPLAEHPHRRARVGPIRTSALGVLAGPSRQRRCQCLARGGVCAPVSASPFRTSASELSDFCLRFRRYG